MSANASIATRRAYASAVEAAASAPRRVPPRSSSATEHQAAATAPTSSPSFAASASATPPEAEDADSRMKRKLQAFYYNVVSPPPLGLHADPEAYETYRRGIDARIERIIEAYAGDWRSLHLDLLERYGSSPFAATDENASAAAAATRGAPTTASPSARPTSMASQMRPETVGNRTFGTRSSASRRELRHSSTAPRHNRSVAPATASSATHTSVDLTPVFEPHHGIAFVPSAGSQGRHPRQVEAVRSIWASMQALPPQPEPRQPTHEVVSEER